MMAEIYSFELSIPDKILQSFGQIEANGDAVSWDGRLGSPHREITKFRKHGNMKRRQSKIKTEDIDSKAEIRISAKKLKDGTLHLTLDRLRLKVVERKFSCLISDVREADDCSVTFSNNEKDVSSLPSVTVDAAGDAGIVSGAEEANDFNSCGVHNKNPLSQEDAEICDSNRSEIANKDGRLCGKNTSKITENNDEADQISGLQMQIKKRKRGRPRKEETSSNSCRSKDCNVANDVNSEGKRYSLRGVKLRKDFIDAEKNGSDEEIMQSDTENVSDGNRAEMILRVPDEMTVPSAKVDGENSCSTNEEIKGDNQETEMPVASNSNLKGCLVKSGVHRRKRNNGREARCKFCSRMFCDFTGVEEHVKKFHSSEEGYQQYIEELQKLKVVKCAQCDMSFKNRYSLQLHEDTAHCKFAGSSCSVCKKKYNSLRSLRHHIRFVHNRNAKEHLCHLCPAKFKWANTLKQHITEIHEGVQNFSCSICGKQFCRKGQLNRHVRIHGMDVSKRILCNICGKGFWYEGNLQRHVETVHRKHKEKYHCSYCGKGFTQKTSMVSHVRLLHFKLYPYMCKHCNKSFPRSRLLEDHMKTAHGDITFKASSLGRQRYKYNKTADDLFYCTYCSSSFFYKAKMVEHIHKAHAADFPFICTICNQGFLMKAYLKKHKKAAHGSTGEEHVSDDEDEEQFTGEVDQDTVRILTPGQSDVVDDTSIQREATEASLVITQNIVDMDDLDLSDADAAAAASLLVQVASGSMTTHYVIQNSDPTESPDHPGNAMAALASEQDSIVQIVTANNGSTQVLLPSHMSGENLGFVETFTEETVSDEAVTDLSQPVEETVILTDPNLQLEDAINNVVVVESET